MRLSLIAAMASNRVIGRDNRLPWHLSADLKRFKRLTLGHTLVMGRKTFESIGRPLPGRSTIVVTRQEGYAARFAPDTVRVVHSVEEALDLSREDTEVFIAGGGDIFQQTLPVADRLYLTIIEEAFPGDAYFPEYDESQWRLVDREDHGPAEDAPFSWSFQTLDRQA